LHDLALVRYGEEKSSKELVFKSSDASEFSIRFSGAVASFGDTRDFWIKMITDAVKALTLKLKSCLVKRRRNLFSHADFGTD
jgi:hypothetical protein